MTPVQTPIDVLLGDAAPGATRSITRLRPNHCWQGQAGRAPGAVRNGPPLGWKLRRPINGTSRRTNWASPRPVPYEAPTPVTVLGGKPCARRLRESAVRSGPLGHVGDQGVALPTRRALKRCGCWRCWASRLALPRAPCGSSSGDIDDKRRNQGAIGWDSTNE